MTYDQWELSGDQGNEWQFGVVNLGAADRYTVLFEATVGSSYYSDIAIDDVSILNTFCTDLR